MNSLERYKKLFPDDTLAHFDAHKRLHIPIWLGMFIVHSVGLKSRKKRILKKILKKELTKAVLKYISNRILSADKETV